MKNELTYIKRKNLDTHKYDTCIKEAINSRIYALSWYLDCASDDWDVLVLGDYEAVMPITFLKLKRHLFIKKIYQPDFCQQLGVFRKVPISKENFKVLFDEFVSLKPYNYSFNSYDSKKYLLYNKELSARVNCELDLSNTYEKISAKYSKNLKRNIAKANKEAFHISDTVSVAEFISMKKEETTYRMVSRQYEKKTVLFNELIDRNLGKVYGVYKEKELIAVCFVIYYQNRLINLSSATNETGKKFGAISFLFDALIKRNASTNAIFDFEGSMILGVARFFRSFGAEEIVYKSLSQ